MVKGPATWAIDSQRISASSCRVPGIAVILSKAWLGGVAWQGRSTPRRKSSGVCYRLLQKFIKQDGDAGQVEKSLVHREMSFIPDYQSPKVAHQARVLSTIQRSR
jgi:hypothetical protein